MEKCIFCEKELTLLQKKKLSCGGTSQSLCSSCYERYKSLPAAERAEAALNTGRAADPDALTEYLRPIRAAQKQAAEEQRRKDESRTSDRKCLRCGQNMLRYGPLTFKLGEERYFFSDIHRLISGSLTMDLFRCPACGKAEFFLPDAGELDRLSEGPNS